MKKYRRIEITAFRRRIQIFAGEQALDMKANEDLSEEEDILINDATRKETIEPESADGRRILTEAVSLLQRRLTDSDTGEER